MTSKFELEWNGDAAMAEITAAAVSAVTAGALIAEGQIKQLTPVGTGNLRDSITHQIRSSDGQQVTAEVGSPLDYAIYQEYGTGEHAENGAGRKGGWYYTSPEGVRIFTMGNRPVRMFRRGFKASRGRIITAMQRRMGEVGK